MGLTTGRLFDMAGPLSPYSAWSRRQFLQRAGVSSAALLSAGALAEFLAACGTQTTTTTGNVKVGWTVAATRLGGLGGVWGRAAGTRSA